MVTPALVAPSLGAGANIQRTVFCASLAAVFHAHVGNSLQFFNIHVVLGSRLAKKRKKEYKGNNKQIDHMVSPAVKSKERR